MSEDKSPYCSAHDEWLIMKLCIRILNLNKHFLRCFMGIALHSRDGDAVTVSAAVATRSRADCNSMEDHRRQYHQMAIPA